MSDDHTTDDYFEKEVQKTMIISMTVSFTYQFRSRIVIQQMNFHPLIFLRQFPAGNNHTEPGFTVTKKAKHAK